MNSPTHPSLRSQAHLAFSRGLPSDKMPKEPSSPSLSNTHTERQCSKNERKLTIKMNNETVTKAKIKRAESANLKGGISNKLHRKLTEKCSEMPASF